MLHYGSPRLEQAFQAQFAARQRSADILWSTAMLFGGMLWLSKVLRVAFCGGWRGGKQWARNSSRQPHA